MGEKSLGVPRASSEISEVGNIIIFTSRKSAVVFGVVITIHGFGVFEDAVASRSEKIEVKQGEEPEVPVGNWSDGPAWWYSELEAPPVSRRSVHVA